MISFLTLVDGAIGSLPTERAKLAATLTARNEAAVTSVADHVEQGRNVQGKKCVGG